MLIINNRYELLDLATKYNIPSIYDLLNKLLPFDGPVAATDGKHIYINPDEFNKYGAQDQFFILSHEMLHIIYKHTEMKKDPAYSNQLLLNICQDVCINEYLANKLKYKQPDGVYLSNLSQALINYGFINYPLSYPGVLTTKQLYEYIERRLQRDQDKAEQLLNSFGGEGSVDCDESLGDGQDGEQEINRQTLKELSTKLRITKKILADEMNIPESQIEDDSNAELTTDYDPNADKIAGAGHMPKPTNSKKANQIYSTRDMIKFIQDFIGNNAVVKGRSRTFNRPNRRVTSNDYIMKGYKHTKNIKEIVIYLDTSGSMSNQLISNLFTTLKTLYQTTKFKLYQFDYYVDEVDMINTDRLSAGGGTDIQGVLTHIDENKFDAAIVITDCEDSFSLKKVKSNVMFFTNDMRFKSDNPLVKVSYFN